MPPFVDPVVCDEALPAESDVVVIGAGIMGIATAMFLAERGVSVTVVEKGRVAHEQSGRNWGWVREQLRSSAEQPLAMLSLRLWRQMSERIGRDAGFRKTGMMVVSKDDAEIARWQAWIDANAHLDLPGGILSAREVAALIPGSAETWKAAIHSPEDGWAEPRIAVPAMAAAAREKGAVIIENCAARGWETEAGRVSHVVTEKGSIRTGAVLLAGGAWSAMMLRHHGVRFLQSGVFGTAFRTQPGPNVFDGGVGSPLFSFRRRTDGGYVVGLRGRGRIELSPMGLRDTVPFASLFLLRRAQLNLRVGQSFFNGPFAWRSWALDSRSPFEAHHARVYDPSPDPRIVDGGLKAFTEAYPELKGLRVAESWGGVIDATPDMVPVIGTVPGTEGLYLSSGYSGHGFAFGPGAGWVMAQQIVGETPDVDLSPFRFSRFAEGKAHEAHHWV
ncbi:NAD(P)/FAD-dependent oxidoreductase [Salipiger abyssi]|uniref:NAD(P)/FAD-dependent oxidoreductase n=1 Tax=Salipiger abyssi TaxID=1250539 RepID=UPI001A8F96AE|nr:FAD-binding oxidoreductase [Salipiger abyssi]MBN9887907.1 FAD-binding oxidoreductase [Salipiger abyssi]